jgi:prefoldin subunit 5
MSSRPVGSHLKYHAALPNLLVGAGLLFTFLGLAVALSSAAGIATGNSDERNRLLKGLLDAASFKFITSIVGLLLSIGYTIFSKHVLRGVEADIDAWCAALEDRIPTVTALSLQQESNELLRTQANHMEVFTNELAVNIGTALDTAFDKRLGEHIGPLSEALEKLATGLDTRSENSVERMLDAFLERLQGGTGDKMATVADTLAGLVVSLNGMKDGLRDAGQRMADAADTMTRRMGEGAEAALGRITGQMSTVVERLGDVAEETRTAGAGAGRELALRIEAAAKGFEESARTVAQTLGEAAQNLERKMGDEATASSKRLQDQLELMVNELKALAEENRKTGTAALDAVSDRIAATAAGFEATAGRIADALRVSASETGGALGRGAEEAVQRIASATEGMRTELAAMLAQLRGSVGEAGEALREGTQAGAALLKENLDTAGTSLANTISAAADNLRVAGQTAGGAIREGGDTAGTQLAEAGRTIGGKADSLARSASDMQEKLTGLAARIRELDAATTGAAGPLLAAAADLRASASSVQATTQPLSDTAQQIRMLMEQVSGMVQRVETVHSAASRLTSSIEEAARRFEGVDQSLAAVLNQMQTGLRGFTQQITTFVKETDGNLAKAATQLGAAVKSLEEVLDDVPRPVGARQGRPV